MGRKEEDKYPLKRRKEEDKYPLITSPSTLMLFVD